MVDFGRFVDQREVRVIQAGTCDVIPVARFLLTICRRMGVEYENSLQA